ncbi:MAG TPA: DUF3500 domain-containing protein [Stellaceae bacterium]|jgi:hypothetical protein|nr:DUF3500 domain-containing protein [Stellaceae bacterium]
MSRPDYHPFLPKPGQSKIAGPTARAHAEARRQSPRAKEFFAQWEKQLAEPFAGITTDGTTRRGLYKLEPNGAPVKAMTDAAQALLSLLTEAQRKASCFAADSKTWRRWQNTENFFEDYGLRLEEISDAQREAALAILRASMSAKGFQMSRDVMRLNRFLGDLVGGPAILGEWSYNFCLFGTPSLSEPWGWQLFGHHLSLNCMVIGGQMVLTPSFWGAEPSHADVGPFAGTTLFEDEERAGLTLMRSFSPEQQRQAIVAHSMVGGDLPSGRRHFADNLHLAGAHQDNRVIPYEGIAAADMSAVQRRNLLDLVGRYIAPLPPEPEKQRMAEIEQHLSETHFCWIGGFAEDSTFYYRVQSPVVMIEFDHHIGVFLTNAEPAKFHVHTIVRTPNGNDYGLDLLRLHYEQSPHHQAGRR